MKYFFIAKPLLVPIPFGEVTYPNLGKGKSSKVPLKLDMLVPWRVNFPFRKAFFEETNSLVSKDGRPQN